MPDLNDLPEPLQRLISEMIDAVVEITGELGDSLDSVVAWQDEMERLLARYHTAAYMAGQGSSVLSADDLLNIQRIVASQIAFLENFATVIQDSDTYKKGWEARAKLYAESVQGSYWKGKTKILPLPAMPSQGSPCASRCRCSWHIDEIDGDGGDWDATWRLGPVAHDNHCQVCLQRAADWSPLQIRNGELVI